VWVDTLVRMELKRRRSEANSKHGVWFFVAADVGGGGGVGADGPTVLSRRVRGALGRVAAQTDAAAALEAALRLSHSSASLEMMSGASTAFSPSSSSSAALFSPSSSSSPDAFSFAAAFLSDPAAGP